MREKNINTLQPVEMEYAFEFTNLFPGVALPEVVGVPTGNQFAVSRDKILERPREDYIKYRQWLMKTPLEDEVANKILGYSWHSKLSLFKYLFQRQRSDSNAVIFGKPAQYCLDPQECYCQTFGRCGLSENDIGKQWVDRGRKLPSSWPGCSRMVDERRGRETNASH